MKAVYGGTPAKKEPKDTRMTLLLLLIRRQTLLLIRSSKQVTNVTKSADHMGEEAAMSDKEVRLQKQKARIDQMIAMRRKQELNKTKSLKQKSHDG